MYFARYEVSALSYSMHEVEGGADHRELAGAPCTPIGMLSSDRSSVQWRLPLDATRLPGNFPNIFPAYCVISSPEFDLQYT